jgi:hypothetical protein
MELTQRNLEMPYLEHRMAVHLWLTLYALWEVKWRIWHGLCMRLETWM